MSNIITKEQEFVGNVSRYTYLVEKIDLTALPTIIDSQVEQIEILSTKINDALSTAEDAKKLAEDAKPVKWGHKKEAIEDLQKANKKSTEAISETVDALKLSFEYEKQLGEISKFLIAIAACSAVHTDQAIERIYAAIQNRPANKPLNDVAKEHLQQIINQMRVQGDTIRKQEALERELEEKDSQDEEQDRQIKEMAADDDRQDALIEELQKKIANLEKWKIVALITSGAALVLTLLQIIGIL
ncbi:MAG: hypothetical protein IKB04_04075 [Clostridia bacterium]|nr:hypothetical protein [Clostridia bacterium]